VQIPYGDRDRVSVLELKNIHFSYEKKSPILDGVTLSVGKGEIAAISGNSGCGKSTLAMVACGVIPKSVHGRFSGSVTVMGEDIKDKEIFETAQHISMVFQDPESQLFSPQVIDEVAFAPENLCFPMQQINDAALGALQTVGMSDFGTFAPDKLSGGQQQLVALASILSLDPEIIILDEVAAQVDDDGTGLLRTAVKSLKQRNKTVIIIEHGNTFADLYDSAYVLSGGTLA